MHVNNMYHDMLFYMEACESGSMFVDLPDSWNIYATTASNGHLSSWAAYCPPHDKVRGKSIRTCLGDLYSINWMEDSDSKKAAYADESIHDQFELVKKRTNRSPVQEFGDLTIKPQSIFNF